MMKLDTAPDRDALLYSLLHRGNPGDLEYYLGCCSGAKNALELGVGYGRIAVALAQRGIFVTGLDNHPGLLGMAEDSAREQRVAPHFSAHLGDMQSFDLARRFERILIPYTGLFCLLGDSAVEACLGCCRAHLLPGGSLCFDVYEADGFHHECDPEDLAESDLEPVVEVMYGEQPLMVYERSSWHKQGQRLDVHYDYCADDGTVVYTSTVRQRYLLVDQIRERLTAAGFEHIQIWGGFRGERVSLNSERVVVEARL